MLADPLVTVLPTPMRNPLETASSGEGISQLRVALEQVLRLDPGMSRLAHAHTSVKFSVAEASHSVALFLDRRPPTVAQTDEPAEIEIELTPQQAELFASGQLAVPAAVLAGRIVARGPVRRFLEIEPTLRAALRRAAPRRERTDLCAPDVATPPVGGVLDRDLLAIETRDLRKSFGGQPVLEGVDLAVPEGMTTAVIGPSGTGKSVLLQHICGLTQLDVGEVLIRGRALSGMTRSELLALRTEIGVMFQDGALFSAMTVFDNVAFPLRQHTDLDEDIVRDVVMERLNDVGLAGATHQYPASLSGGMKKRAGLARALVLQPSILVCDEPDSGLDPVRTALLADLLVEQHEATGGAMLVVTHDIALAKRIAEYVAVLWQGRIVESGTREDVFASDNPFVQQFLAGEVTGPLSMDA